VKLYTVESRNFVTQVMKQWLNGSRQMFTRSPWLVNRGKLLVQFWSQSK